MNMMAPSPAVPNLLDGGGLLNPAPSGMPAQLQLNHEPIAPQNQTPNFSSGLYINKSYHFSHFQNVKLLANFFSVIERSTLVINALSWYTIDACIFSVCTLALRLVFTPRKYK